MSANLPSPRGEAFVPYTGICRSCQRERPVNLIGECLNCTKSAVDFFDDIMKKHERRVAAIERAHRWRMTLVAVVATLPLWVPALVLLWRCFR